MKNATDGVCPCRERTDGVLSPGYAANFNAHYAPSNLNRQFSSFSAVRGAQSALSGLLAYLVSQKPPDSRPE